MKIVFGLGNPGLEYAKNRHNTGFIIVDVLAESKGLTWENNSKLSCNLAKGKDVIFAKPSTFMNNSGKALLALKEYFKVGLEDICVVHDDVDLEFGKVKEQRGAGHAGHRGVMDIIGVLGTQDFLRIRVGIGRPSADSEIPVDRFVLMDFSDAELSEIKKAGTLLAEKF